MENDEKAGMAPDAGMATPRQTATAAEAHPKPMLTVEQQIAHMKTKEITFNLVSEGEAAAHLREKCQFFRVYAYRKLFPKHVGGPRDGQYVGLDFGNLKELSNLDRKLRDALLPMTLDVEHFAKVRLLAAAEDRGEDGYALMRDYLEASTDEQRNHLRTELKQRRNDPYAGAVVRKYQGDMPVWAFCEVVSFGTFTDLLRFCAARWDDKKLRRDHYQYKDTRQVRNASAHGACILNDITSSDVPARPPAALVNAMNSYGIPQAPAHQVAERAANGANLQPGAHLRRHRAGGFGPFRTQEPALRPVRRGGGQLPSRREPGDRGPALPAALDKGRRAARLSSHYKAFGLIGAGLRNRFCPVF